MVMAKILVINRNKEVLEVLLRLINQNKDWLGIGFSKDAEAIAAFNKEPYDLVLLGSGITTEEEKALRQHLLEKNPSQKIIQHWGGGSGLLSNEIFQALA